VKQDDGDDLSPALSDANGSIAARIVSDFDQFGFASCSRTTARSRSRT
jgi:hypothetical protein